MLINSTINYEENIISAPSNIALIKYMGLADIDKKIPANPSLSYTLNQYRSYIKITRAEQDLIETPAGNKRFYDFYLFLKNKFNVSDNFHLVSCNNFPTACGLASSASSFAALTAAIAYIANVTDTVEVANISRHGSGSSCRSFFDNFVSWSEDGIIVEDLPKLNLEHAVLLLDKSRKTISSSMAHLMVKTSPKFGSRITNANIRYNQLKHCIKNNLWDDSANIIKEDYLEMHNLFETSNPAFSYRSRLCKNIESWLESYITIFGKVPWVTLDAGPNIHLLFPDPESKIHCINEIKKQFNNLEILGEI